jgi:hypothetical protein
LADWLAQVPAPLTQTQPAWVWDTLLDRSAGQSIEEPNENGAVFNRFCNCTVCAWGAMACNTCKY